MGQGELLKPIRLIMKIETQNVARRLIKTNVIEASIRSPLEILDLPVRHQEPFLPSHKNIVLFSVVFMDVVTVSCLIGDSPPRREPAPVIDVVLVICAPVTTARVETVLGANHFSLKIRCQCGVVFCEALDAQVATKKRFLHVDILEFNVDFVCRATRLLCTNEARAGSKKRRRVFGNNTFW